MQNADQPYLFTEFQPAQPLTQTREAELSSSRILLHVALLIVTGICTTLTGAGSAVQVQVPDDASILQLLFAPILAVLGETAAGNLDPLLKGLLFTFTLLTILGAHELGHYFACRHYGIRATLPFFIPAPPSITPFGTFGAVIKIKEPIRSRKALFDIGIAGPLAGFAFALPAAVIGLVMASPAQIPDTSTASIQFNDPLLFILFSKILGVPKWIEWNPVYWAAWGTILVTALNLFPVGQLDGGHVIYAVLGRRVHKWTSFVVAGACGTLAITTILLHQPPVYLLWTLVLLFLLKVGHPPVIEEEPLGALRIALAILSAIVFLLCFMPFPITAN